MNVREFWDAHPVGAVAGATVIIVLAVGLVWSVARDSSDTLDPALAIVTLESCSDDESTGTIENLADRSVTPVVEVRFLDADGAVMQKGSVTDRG